MRIRPLLLAALALAAAPGAAVAAPWSAPATFPTSVGNSPTLALGAGGGPQAVYWNNYTGGIVPGLPGPGGQVSTSVSTLGPGLLPGPPRPVTPPFAIGGFGQIGDAGVGGSGVVLPDAAGGVATGPLTGPLAVHALPATVRGIATNAAGDVAVVIEPCATNVSGCHPAAPSLVRKRRGHAFGRPIVLGPKGHAYDAAVAIDPRGRVLVAWDHNGGVYARFVSSAGKLGRTQHIGSEAGYSRFQAVLPGDGRAVVAWTSQDVSEGDATSPFTARVALAGASGRFGRAQLLETVAVKGTGRYVPYQGLIVSMAPREPGLAAWTGYAAGRYVVRAAPILGTLVGASQIVSAPGVDAVLTAAAEGARGEAAILILPGRAGADPRIGTQPGGLAAVTRPAAGQPFGAPEQIVPAPAYIDGAALGIDAPSGAAFVTWRDVGGPIAWSVRTPIG